MILLNIKSEEQILIDKLCIFIESKLAFQGFDELYRHDFQIYDYIHMIRFNQPFKILDIRRIAKKAIQRLSQKWDIDTDYGLDERDIRGWRFRKKL